MCFKVLYAGHREVDSGRELWEAIRDVVIADGDRLPFLFVAEDGRRLGFDVTEPSDELDGLFERLRSALSDVTCYVGFVPESEAKP